MANEDIDTRSDIYSLGVLLYVLLTGVLPFDYTTFREGGIEHIRQVIRETDPKTPSTRLSSLGEEAKKVAQSRRIEVAALVKCLHKELEWIPLKAIRKERSERFRSASEFADDIENYLKGYPLIAGPPGTLYRLRKSARRHKALVAGTLTVVGVSIIGVVVSMIFALGQARARDEAQAINDFLTNKLLASTNPFSGDFPEITVPSVLDGIAMRLESEFVDRPLVKSSILHSLGKAYWWHGKPNEAEVPLGQALRIYQQKLGEKDPETLESMFSLGRSTKDDPWIEPVNLGPTVNTWADEILPYISSDSSTLYFTSSRLGGFGNFDLWQVSLAPIVDTNGNGKIDLDDLCNLAEHQLDNE